MNKSIIQISLVTASIFLSMVALNQAEAQNFQPIPKTPNINEDQVIVCVSDTTTKVKGDLNCHLYNTDDLDYYQDANDGTFFNHNDSFEMGLID